MRLTCPNCDAKYEVPDEVIPTSGRDVQCSNCGQTWYFYHPDHMPDEGGDPTEALPDPDEEIAAPPPPPPPPPKEPERKQLDPAVADILRQEAELEYEARKQRQSSSIETQPDLGLDAADQEDGRRPLAGDPEEEAEERAMEARRRMARMRGEPDPAEAAAAATASARGRELLPDIDEINSTLRRENTREGSDADVHGDVEAAAVQQRKRGGFRRGFLLIMLIAVILALIYIYAPQIAERVPQADPYLSSYVTWVDKMRLALDAQLRNLLAWLDGVAAGSGE